MFYVLFQILGCAFLGALNLYGASLIYYQERLLNKAGLLLFFLALVLLLDFFRNLALPHPPHLLVFSNLVFFGAAMSSLVVRLHLRLFRGLHHYQHATHPKMWQALLNMGHFFFSRLVPAMGAVGQVMMIFSK
jgi:hypothetical protein